MNNKKILKNIIDAKRKNPYTENKTINQLRKETENAGSLIPLPENIKYKSVVAGNVNAEWITCGKVNENKIFMFMHGGGYYRGSIAATRATVARISAEAKVKCLSINYRLAPEHPFPAAIDDTYSAYEWLINEGISPEHIIVSGQSAGGGLCLALLLKIDFNYFYYLIIKMSYEPPSQIYISSINVALHKLPLNDDVIGLICSYICLLYTSPSPRDKRQSRMPSSA